MGREPEKVNMQGGHIMMDCPSLKLASSFGSHVSVILMYRSVKVGSSAQQEDRALSWSYLSVPDSVFSVRPSLSKAIRFTQLSPHLL